MTCAQWLSRIEQINNLILYFEEYINISNNNQVVLEIIAPNLPSVLHIDFDLAYDKATVYPKSPTPLPSSKKGIFQRKVGTVATTKNTSHNNRNSNRNTGGGGGKNFFQNNAAST